MGGFKPAIGIDLGTTNSCVSIVEDGVPQVIPNLWGDRIHASVVFFPGDDQETDQLITPGAVADLPAFVEPTGC